MAYTKVKYIIEQTVASGLIYPQFATRATSRTRRSGPISTSYLRGSNGY